MKPVSFTVTVSVTGSPGNTTPLVGDTVIQAALPTAAVKVIAPPVVVSVSVCGVGISGGVVKLKDDALTTSVGSGCKTVSVTGMLIAVNPVAETWMFTV